MAPIDFIDQVKIYVRAGKGGAGAKHFRRERFIPKGGPDGGDGGKGGSVILQGDTHLSTLLPLRYRKHVIAPNGMPGSGNQRTGANGEDILLRVPLGTVIKDATTGKIQHEITSVGKPYVLAAGGRGGLGNAHFKSATNQAPQKAQPGEVGQELEVVLELKILADIGLVGAPNAGKSTLLSVLSAARPKIASYPFTTLVPQLGTVLYKNVHTFVIADIPGLIAGASEGKGLGLRFLRHVERNKLLLFMVPSDAQDPLATYTMLRNELGQHNPALLDKPHILAFTKIDLITPEQLPALLQTIPKEIPTIAISAIVGTGIESLKTLLFQQLKKITSPNP